MRLIEVVEGEETSPETLQAAANFAQAIRKMPIRCGRVPGLRRQPHPRSRPATRDLALPGRDGRRRRGARRAHHRSRRRCRWARSASPTWRAWTRSLKVARDMRDAYGDRFYVHRGHGGARRARRPRRQDAGRASMSTAETDRGRRADRRALHAEGVRRGLPRARGGRRRRARHRPRDDDGHRHGPRAVRARRLARARRRAGRARAGRGGVGRALRAAADPAPARRAGPARRQERPGLLPLPAARAGLRAGAGQARPRAATSRSLWLDNPPANSLSPGRGRGARDGLGRRRGQRRARDGHRLAEPGAVLRRRRHQGVHADGRGGRPRAARRARTRCCARWERSRDR